MTKTEYAGYIQSEDWQRRRKIAIEKAYHRCQRCELPRWVAGAVYGKDLNVHHRNYQNLGNEQPGDLEVLCQRCHDIETFGRSDFREIKQAKCSFCDQLHHNVYSEYCAFCEAMSHGWFDQYLTLKNQHDGRPLWHSMLRTLGHFVLNGGVTTPEILEILRFVLRYEEFCQSTPPKVVNSR